MTPFDQRFWSKVDFLSDPHGCWIWRGNVSNGYGRFTIGATGFRAHRVSYAITTGAPEVGQHVDHMCRNKLCVNPAHLEAVSHRENVIVRGTGPFAARARQTHCKWGHEFTPENTIIHGGRRECHACYLAAQKKLRDNLTEEQRAQRRAYRAAYRRRRRAAA